MQYVNVALEWIEAHPVLFAVVLWPLVTAAVTWLFKPRTPAEYDAMNPRVAEALRLIAALGIDPAKALDAIRKLLSKGPKDPPDGPSGGLRVIAGGVAAVALACLACLACAPAYASDPSIDDAIERCERVALQARDAGPDARAAAYADYQRCLRGAGL